MPSFNADAVARIRKSVKFTEGLSRDLTGGKRQVQHDEPSFWAMLTGMNVNGNVYSWIRAKPDGKGGYIPDPRARGGNLYEVNGKAGVMPGTVVRVFLMGQGEDGNSAYTFMAPPPGPEWPRVPIHDHRSNEAGGYAYAVYHPGSAIPAQPWAI